MRLLLLFMITTTFLSSIEIEKAQTVKIKELKDGTMMVKIALNYENPIEMSRRIRGVDGIYNLPLPIPGSWKVLSAKGYLSYSPSILLQKDHSAGVINFNNMNIKQFKLFKYEKTGVKFSINPKYIKEYNQLRIEMIQHYTDKCEDGASSQLWTDINLIDSYIEFHIEKIAIPEEIHSLTTHMIDGKQYKIEPINYVISKKPTDKELLHYAHITGAVANSIQYRMAPISVSNSLELKEHNVIVSPKESMKQKLLSLKPHFLFDNDPIYSLHFNKKNLQPLIHNSINLSLSSSGVALLSKKAFHGKSASLEGGKIRLSKLPILDKDNVTVAFWFKANSKRTKYLEFGFENYKLTLNKRDIGFSTHKGDIYGKRVKLNNGWHHIVARFNSQDIRKNSLYLDGKKLKLRRVTGKIKKENIAFTSSADISGYGAIDQLYFFDKTLDSKTRSKLYKLAKQYKKKSYKEALFISEKLLHDINVLINPISPDKIILLISPDEESKITDVIYGFYKKDLSLYFRQGLNIDAVTIPPKADAYSAKDYIPVDTDISFRELGYETTVLRGWYPPSISIDFKVYPDHYFNSKDTIEAHLNYVFPTTVNSDSVSNIFINDKFAKQIDIMETSKTG
ncbi:MAG: cellulose biosynthesis cyclic di-GMP-binding regulatory protein BcsB, partial [Campylobacterota bacterium]|nr:cellulose biosynthesis cyclic di-GMP-binding regulatory protein BcsB [Campylobacterota bacterium]